MWSKSIEVLNPYEALSKSEAAQRERSQKYDCDGVCYTDTSMCPRAEICPETRRAEFCATIAAALTMIVVPIAAAAVIIYLICSNL